MTETVEVPTSVMVASFLKRLEAIEAIVRVVLSDARVSAFYRLRGHVQRTVLMDFAGSPARVTVNGQNETAHIYVTIDAGIMHDILVGRVKPGVAVGRREMLLRGSAIDLAKFIPLFDLAPVLYSEHLADIGHNGFIRGSGDAPLREVVMTGQAVEGKAINRRQSSRLERAIFGMTKGVAYAMGYVVGFMRYRLFENMSLFEALEAMSRGIEAAKPRTAKNGDSADG
jgi:hypothetical protein